MRRKTVIVDIDGTLSKIGDRLKYIKQDPKDWDSFYASCFNDEPIKEMCELVWNLSFCYKIVFCTGRREQVRVATYYWLSRNVFKDFFEINGINLLMRKNEDKRPDTEIKIDLLKESGIELDDIAFVLEDRSRLVEMYRKLGIRCLQVDKGDF